MYRSKKNTPMFRIKNTCAKRSQTDHKYAFFEGGAGGIRRRECIQVSV